MWPRPAAPGALALLVASASVAGAGAVAPMEGAAAGNFQEWLRHVSFGAPAISLDMSAVRKGSTLNFDTGSCTALNVGGVRTRDSSTGPQLLWSFNISGVGIKCTLHDSSLGLSLNASLAGSWVAASLAVQGMDMMGNGKVLPVAAMMSDCSTGLQVSDLTFGGPSELATEFNAHRSQATAALLASLQDFLCTEIPKEVTRIGTNTLEGVAFPIASLMMEPPLTPLPRAVAPLVDWGTYPPVLLGRAMLSQRFDKWQGNLEGNGTFSKTVGRAVDVTPDFGVRVGGVKVHGLNSIPYPGLNFSGNAQGLIDVATAARQLSLTVSGDLHVAPLQQQMIPLAQAASVTIGVRDLLLAVRAVAMLDKVEFGGMGVTQLQQPGCLIDCARSAAQPHNRSLGLRKLDLELSGLELMVGAAGPLAGDLATLVDAVVGSLLRGYLQSFIPVANNFVTFFLSGQVDPGSSDGLISKTLNDRIWEFIGREDFKCNKALGVQGVVSRGALKGLWVTSVALAFLGILAGVFACCMPCGRKQEEVEKNAPPLAEEDPEASSAPSQSFEEPAEADSSLFAEVPRPLAVFFPFAVLSVMFLFFVADLALGTSVNLNITAGGQSTVFKNLFSFSLINTITSTWKAKAYAISILTLLFSGLWPLVKLVLLMVAWLAPPKRVSLSTRGRLLSFLDVWGKYSFLDSWFLVLCMSAFAMKWEGGGASLHVHTSPTVAYYAFLLATILSLLLGNVASYFHRSAERKSLPQGGSGHFTVGGRRALGRIGRSLAVQVSVAALLFASIVVTVIGAIATAFEFGMSGLGADLIFQEDRHTESFSMALVGTSVASSAQGNGGLVALEAVFIILSLVIPVLLLIALELLWLVPLRPDQQDTLLYVCHVLDAWACLDVFVLAVLIGHLEFSQLAGRLLRTGPLKGVCLPLQKNFDLSCMELDLGLLPGFGLLAAAGILALAVPKSIHQLCRANVEARDAPMKVREGSTETATDVYGCNSCGTEHAQGETNEVVPSDGDVNAAPPRGDGQAAPGARDDSLSVGGGPLDASQPAAGAGSEAFVPRASG